MGVQQTVKELVDNAIDACRWRSAEQDAPTIRVVLRRLPALQRNNEGDGTNDGDNAKGTHGTLSSDIHGTRRKQCTSNFTQLLYDGIRLCYDAAIYS